MCLQWTFSFCNTMEFPLATFWTLHLQHSVFLFYNKYLGFSERINSKNISALSGAEKLVAVCLIKAEIFPLLSRL
jgi:hypothetical protein